MTIPNELPQGKQHTTPWTAYVVVLVIGFIAGSYLADGKTTLLATRVSAADERVKSIEERVKGIEERMVKLASDVGTAKEAVQSLDADGYLALGNPDTYQNLGPFWQIRKLQLMSDPQGCRVTGEILYRLSMRRQNVDLSLQLMDSSFKTVASGTSVLSAGISGRYTSFSVLVRTDAKLSDIATVHLTLNENSGTTAALY